MHPRSTIRTLAPLLVACALAAHPALAAPSDAVPAVQILKAAPAPTVALPSVSLECFIVSGITAEHVAFDAPTQSHRAVAHASTFLIIEAGRSAPLRMRTWGRTAHFNPASNSALGHSRYWRAAVKRSFKGEVSASALRV